MLLNHDQLLDLIRRGVIEHAQPDAVNQTSIDIHLGEHILVECYVETLKPVDYRARQRLSMREIVLDADGYVLRPGEFILAQSVEMFHLPLDLSAEYKLKSSMARIGLEHLNAGWCDPGWHGSVLTLELKNIARYHEILLRPGDAIGQMVFFESMPVSEAQSYATKGRYNGDLKVSAIK